MTRRRTKQSTPQQIRLHLFANSRRPDSQPVATGYGSDPQSIRKPLPNLRLSAYYSIS